MLSIFFVLFPLNNMVTQAASQWVTLLWQSSECTVLIWLRLFVFCVFGK